MAVIATYGYRDLKNGQRLHRWGSSRFAIGNGPIRYITKAEADEYLRVDKASSTEGKQDGR